MIVCCYEDRVGELLGVKLLVCSLRRNVPDVSIHLCVPGAPPEFERWATGHPNVTLDRTADPYLNGWSAKPALLLRMLDAGHDQAIWIDSDLIVAGDFRRLLADDASLVGTEELCRDPIKATRLRTTGWGLPVGRRVPHLINSAFVRVLPSHREVLTEWVRLMRTPEYQAAQKVPFHQRPTHMISDQDVLTALLGAVAFARIPLRVLRRGREIIHDPEGGYHPVDRIVNAWGRDPLLVHGQSGKPWRYQQPASLRGDWNRYYNFLHVETSPYGHQARKYRDELGEDAGFLEVRSLYGKAAWALARGNPHLPGMLQAFATIVKENARHTLSQVQHAARVAGRLGGQALRAVAPKPSRRRRPVGAPQPSAMIIDQVRAEHLSGATRASGEHAAP
jgi:hypothetical protein